MKLKNNTCTIRGNGRWAKVTKLADQFAVALGFAGDLKAFRVQHFNATTRLARDWAEVVSEGWIADGTS